MEINIGSAARTGWNSVIGSFVISKSTSQTEEHNIIYGREVKLSMWIGLIWLRAFGNQGI